MTRPVVLYVAGWGRSGSTLLDVMLGSLPGVTSTGELRHLWDRGLQQRRRCGCGVAVPDCPHWRAVLARLGGYPDPDGELDPASVRADQAAAARTRHALRLAAEGHDDGAPGATRLRGLQERLFRAIVAETGDPVVVDSSKMPGDLALLVTTPGIDVHVVHLVRDPRAVAWSWQRRKLMTDLETPRPIGAHSPTRSSLQWVTWNLLIERVARRAASRTLVRYEDLVADPAAVLARLARQVGIPPAAVGDLLDGDEYRVAVSHTVAGNPSRFATGSVRVRLDDEWRRAQPAGQRRAAAVPALALLRRYGYPIRVGTID